MPPYTLIFERDLSATIVWIIVILILVIIIGRVIGLW